MSSRADNWTLFYANLPKNQDINQKMAQIIGFNCFQLGQEEWILNLFCPDSKLLGLSDGAAEAVVYRIEPISAAGDFESFVPVWRDLKVVAFAENVASLIVPEQNPLVFRGKQPRCPASGTKFDFGSQDPLSHKFDPNSLNKVPKV
jgi:hypothetical protein